MEAAVLTIPRWLEEQCERLQDTGTNIRNLNLNIRRLNVIMLQALASALLKNPRIETINLTSSLSRDPDHTILPFLLVLSKHPSLEFIHLSYNRLKSVPSIGITLCQNTQLLELYLDYNLLTAQTAIALAEGLQQNQTLRVLQLNSNRIGDEGGVALALALRKNKSLRVLGMNRNQLGKASAMTLFSSLEENLWLTSLQIDKNPDLACYTPLLLYIVRTNKAGRYLLRNRRKIPRGLWPLVLKRLDHDMISLKKLPAIHRPIRPEENVPCLRACTVRQKALSVFHQTPTTLTASSLLSLRQQPHHNAGSFSHNGKAMKTAFLVERVSIIDSRD
eukprot:scaffold20339_cov128-Cylindrotheca_fusiformis.AAC.13